MTTACLLNLTTQTLALISVAHALCLSSARTLCRAALQAEPTAAIQVAVKLPPGMRAQKLTRGKNTDKQQPTQRAPWGAEALQAEFSASRSIVSVSEYDTMTPEVLEDEVFENERFIPIRGFKASHLLPLDPGRYASCECK